MTAVADPAAGTPTGTPAAEPAAAGAPAAAPKLPETYKLAKPKDSLLSDDAVKRAIEISKGLKLPSDAEAELVLGFAHEQATEVIKQYEAARQPDGTVYKALVAQYEAESLAHPELGNGDPNRLEQKALNAGLVLNQYGPEYRDVLKATGTAGRKEALLFLNRIHAAMQEKPMATGQPAPKAVDPIKGLFPDGIPDDVGATNQRP